MELCNCSSLSLASSIPYMVIALPREQCPEVVHASLNRSIYSGISKKKSQQSFPLRWLIRSKHQLGGTQAGRSDTLDGYLHKGLSIHCFEEKLSPQTDVATYASLLRRCTKEKVPSQAEWLHGLIIRDGHADNVLLNNLLVQMHAKCGSLQHAREVFHSMVYRNLYSWTIMLAACAQNGHGKEALQLFNQMQSEGFEPDKINSICVLDACASVEALEKGREIHATVVRNGWGSDVVVGSALVNMYGKCGNLDDARAAFVEISHQNLVSWSAMITACAQNRSGKEALQLFLQMQAEGFKPNKITSTCVLDACASVAALVEGREIHAMVVGNGWEPSIVLGTALVNLYGKCRSLDDARAVFVEMPRQDVVLWNAMITAAAQNGHAKEALLLFSHMEAEGFKANKITSICVLEACANAPTLEEGLHIHASVVCNGLESDVVDNALINMYGKCGSLHDARIVFAEMPHRSKVSWSAMIAACAQNGHGKQALQLFGQMQAEGFKPNEITFICVLTACSHMGLVSDGTRCFTSMCQDHGITPSMEHYVCMIDLFGRAGQLDKAEQICKSMPFDSVCSAWLSLLSSCRMHGDVERGLRAANLVFDLDEKLYVSLTNIHVPSS